MRRLILPPAFCLLLLGAAATARAAQRYASPGGTGPSAECPQANPCSLSDAIEKAKTSDEVIVTTGVYNVASRIALSFEGSGVNIHGDFGGPMPAIRGSFPQELLGLGVPGVRLSYLEVVNEAENAEAVFCYDEGVVERVVLSVSGKSSKAISLRDSCLLRNSLVLADGSNAAAIRALGSEASGTARNVTAVASGPMSVGVRSDYPFPFAGSYTLDLRNAIAEGEGADLEAVTNGYGAGSVTVSNSNFDSSTESGAAKVTPGGGNQTAAPLFVDAAAGDYREAPGSPTIDAGVADPLIGGLDLAGSPRIAGQGPDIGAYEFVPPAPLAPPLPPIARLESLTLRPTKFRSLNAGGAIFSATKKAPAPVGTTVSYALSTAGSAQFTVERGTVGRRAKGKCVEKTRANAAKKHCGLFKPVRGSFTAAGVTGQNQLKFSGRIGNQPLKPGAYRLVGSAGGVVKRASFRIVK